MASKTTIRFRSSRRSGAPACRFMAFPPAAKSTIAIDAANICHPINSLVIYGSGAVRCISSPREGAPMKRLARFLLAAAVLASAPVAAHWPERPVKIVLPLPAGSSADAIARGLAEKLSARWGQPVIVENKPGGGTIVATDTVAKSGADGYTLGWVITAHAINATLQPHLPYDPVKDFAGVTLLYQLKAAIVVSPALPVSTVDELVSWIRAQGHVVSYASPGIATGPQLLGELFRLNYGLDMQHVPYKGA